MLNNMSSFANDGARCIDCGMVRRVSCLEAPAIRTLVLAQVACKKTATEDDKRLDAFYQYFRTET